MIRRCTGKDFEEIYEIINQAAEAYRGVIPDDCWHEPYMSREQLSREISADVRFWGWEIGGTLAGVMGLQDKGEVVLIRHAYIRTVMRNRGIGSCLLRYLESTTEKAILIGTWAEAAWAIAFYQKHGYRPVATKEKDQLLRKYWDISERQMETSVVLVHKKWDDLIITRAHCGAPAP